MGRHLAWSSETAGDLESEIRGPLGSSSTAFAATSLECGSSVIRRCRPRVRPIDLAAHTNTMFWLGNMAAQLPPAPIDRYVSAGGAWPGARSGVETTRVIEPPVETIDAGTVLGEVVRAAAVTADFQVVFRFTPFSVWGSSFGVCGRTYSSK